jgi:hypothetical protein
MSNYCLIENGQIIKYPGPLPKNWGHVSNLRALSEADLKKHGWLPVEDVIDDWDPKTHQIGDPTYEIRDDKVIRRRRAEPLPEPEPEAVLEQTDTKMIRVIEDLFDALKAKGVLADGDLPKEAVDRIEGRKTARGSMK